jgi:hypothetical protein
MSPLITLIPNSGIQFWDIGFELDTLPRPRVELAQRDGEAQRGGVAGREPDVEMIRGGRPRQLDLFPPRAAPARNRPRREAAGVERHGDRLGGVEHELVLAGAAVGRPFAQQSAEIAADAGRAAAELARVYADAHKVLCIAGCSSAAISH